MPLITCKSCNKPSSNNRRGYCHSCYCKLLSNGFIKKLPVKPIPDALSHEQKSVLLGSLLGDGSLSLSKNNRSINARLTIRRQLSDKDYLLWEYKLFEKFCGTKPRQSSYLDKRTSKTYHTISFQTRAAPVLTSFYNDWYPNNIKNVPKNIILDPIILLIWFLDDGNFYKKCIKLSTDGFIIDDVIFLTKILSCYLNSKCTFYKNNDLSSKAEDIKNKGYRIYLPYKATNKFIDIINPIFPEFMERKRKW